MSEIHKSEFWQTRMNRSGNLKKRPRVAKDSRRKSYRRSAAALREREGVENGAFDDQDEPEVVQTAKDHQNVLCAISRRHLDFDDAQVEVEKAPKLPGQITAPLEPISNVRSNQDHNSLILQSDNSSVQLSVASTSSSTSGDSGLDLNSEICLDYGTPKRNSKFHRNHSIRSSGSSSRNSKYSKGGATCSKSTTKPKMAAKKDFIETCSLNGMPSHFLVVNNRLVDHEEAEESGSVKSERITEAIKSDSHKMAGGCELPARPIEGASQQDDGIRGSNDYSGNDAFASDRNRIVASTSAAEIATGSDCPLHPRRQNRGASTGTRRNISSEIGPECRVHSVTRLNRNDRQEEIESAEIEVCDSSAPTNHSELLPDILNAHLLPPYSTLPHVVKETHPRSSQTGIDLEAPLTPSCRLERRRLASASRRSTGRRRRRSSIDAILHDLRISTIVTDEETDGGDLKRCCCAGANTQSISIRWLIVMIAFVGLSCAIVGTVLGALKASGREHLTVALLLISVGLCLIIVSGIAWKLTSHDAPSCQMMLGISSNNDRRTDQHFLPRVPPLYGRPHHPFAGLTYLEFPFRPPPPSYQASMQEYRLRSSVLGERHPQPAAMHRPSSNSPPPTYRSNVGSTILVRPPILGPRENPPSYSSHASLNNLVSQDGANCDSNSASSDCGLPIVEPNSNVPRTASTQGEAPSNPGFLSDANGNDQNTFVKKTETNIVGLASSSSCEVSLAVSSDPIAQSSHNHADCSTVLPSNGSSVQQPPETVNEEFERACNRSTTVKGQESHTNGDLQKNSCKPNAKWEINCPLPKPTYVELEILAHV